MARVLITVLRLLQLVLSLASIGLSSYGASFFYGVAECLTLKLDCAASARFHSWLTIYPTCSYQLFRDGKQAFNTIILLFHDRRFYSVDSLAHLSRTGVEICTAITSSVRRHSRRSDQHNTLFCRFHRSRNLSRIVDFMRRTCMLCWTGRHCRCCWAVYVMDRHDFLHGSGAVQTAYHGT